MFHTLHVHNYTHLLCAIQGKIASSLMFLPQIGINSWSSLLLFFIMCERRMAAVLGSTTVAAASNLVAEMARACPVLEGGPFTHQRGDCKMAASLAYN